MALSREPVTAADAPAAVGPYHHAIRSGGLLFCSGQVPIDPATGKLVEGTIGDRTRQSLANLEAVCAAAGTSIQNAVRCTVLVTDMSVFKDVNEAYGAYFAGEPPARTTFGVAALPLGADVEIDAIVALED
jgi:2-iminobutanoate/2-iminopropanoate deaminase